MQTETKRESIIKTGMSYGTWTAIMWAASFLCSMYAQEAPLVGAMSTPLALFSLYYITRLVARGANETERTSFLSIMNLTLWAYLFCAMFTTFVQAIYFIGFDGGRFASMMQQSLSIIDLSQFPGDMREQMQQLIELFRDPQETIRLLLLQNMLMGFVFSFFTAPAAYFMQPRKKQ